MKKPTMTKRAKRILCLGVICVLLAAVSSWYTVVFNDSRFVGPMDLSEYAFRVQDLPMILSGVMLASYLVYLAVLLLRAIVKNGGTEQTAQYTRIINPKLGYLGFLGFLGCLGFWSYHVDKTVFPFVFFLFFGFFGFFYEGRLSNTFVDERFKENRMKAQRTATGISRSIIFLALLLLGQGKLFGNLEYTLIAFVVVVALAMALEQFLGVYLLYHYDNDGQPDESGE